MVYDHSALLRWEEAHQGLAQHCFTAAAASQDDEVVLISQLKPDILEDGLIIQAEAKILHADHS